MTDKIIVGQEYKLILSSDDATRTSHLRTAGLRGYVNSTKYNGITVKIKQVRPWMGIEQVWIENNSDECRGISNYWFPSDCFEPIEFEFVLGEYYICNKKPGNDELANSEFGWGSEMDNLNVPLKCTSLHGHAAKLTAENWLRSYFYVKPWVMPYRQKTVKKSIKRNVFNFWPGLEGKK